MSIRKKLLMQGVFIRICCGLISLLIAASIFRAVAIQAETVLRAALSVSGGNLLVKSDNVLAESFDISPNGHRLAVGFGVAEAPGLVSSWVAEWDVATKRLIVKRRIEGPAPSTDTFPNPQYGSDLRFTPDGSKLVVQTGRHIRLLDAGTLATRYTISEPEIRPTPPEGVVMRRFAISADGKWLGILSTAATFFCQPSDVRLFNLDTGERVAEWTLPQACSMSLSLSPDGDRILLSDFQSAWPADADVVVADSRTGRILEEIDAGYGGHGTAYGVYDAQFIANDRFITLPNVSVWSRSSLPLHTLKVWNANTRQLVHQLGYSEYGIFGASTTSLVAAARAPVVAVVSNRGDPRKITRDDDSNVGSSHLLLFRLDESRPFYVSPELNDRVVTSSLSTVRLSADGRMVALMEGMAVKVYEVGGNMMEARTSR